MQDKVMSWIQQTLIVDYEQSLSTDYDFDLSASDMFFIFLTHCLVRKIICAKLFIHPTIHDKVMGQTRHW